MERLKIAQYIALGATIVSIVGAALGGMSGKDIGIVIMGIGFIAGIVSYIFGGFGTAIKMAAKIAHWGWYIVPFPYDLLTFLIALPFSIIAFIFLPIIPVRKAYKERRQFE